MLAYINEAKVLMYCAKHTQISLHDERSRNRITIFVLECSERKAKRNKVRFSIHPIVKNWPNNQTEWIAIHFHDHRLYSQYKKKYIDWHDSLFLYEKDFSGRTTNWSVSGFDENPWTYHIFAHICQRFVL